MDRRRLMKTSSRIGRFLLVLIPVGTRRLSLLAALSPACREPERDNSMVAAAVILSSGSKSSDEKLVRSNVAQVPKVSYTRSSHQGST